MKWFEGYLVSSTQIFIRCHLRFFLGWLLPKKIFRVAAWKTLGVILLINLKKKKQVSTLKKIWVDFTGYPSNHLSGCRLKWQRSYCPNTFMLCHPPSSQHLQVYVLFCLLSQLYTTTVSSKCNINQIKTKGTKMKGFLFWKCNFQWILEHCLLFWNC